MGQGYRPQPVNGFDALAKRMGELGRELGTVRNAAPIRNSQITGGTGLTVKDPSGQAIQSLVGSDGISKMLFTPPTADQVSDWAAAIAFDPDGSYGGGELTLMSPQAPVFRLTDQPAQTGFINLTSGDGVSSAGSVGLAVTDMALQVIDAAFGNPAKIVLGVLGSSSHVEEDISSWRLFAGNASLVFPPTISEVRVRDSTNAAYTVIRASAFTVTSTREAKQDIRDLGWSAADVVARAKAQQYRYRPDHADPTRLHFGPMAEDLPAELVDNADPESPAVNTMDLIGVLWGAVGELVERNRALAARVDALESAAQ